MSGADETVRRVAYCLKADSDHAMWDFEVASIFGGTVSWSEVEPCLIAEGTVADLNLTHIEWLRTGEARKVLAQMPDDELAQATARIRVLWPAPEPPLRREVRDRRADALDAVGKR